MQFGVIGLGKITTTFVKEFAFIDNAKVIIAGSREPAKAKTFCDEYHIPEAGTYEDVINHPSVQAIYIGTPHHAHYAIAKQALLSGKHVLCEKSITTDARQYYELSAIANEKGLMLMDAMWTYFLPAMVKAKQWIDEGRIGQVKYVNIDFAFPAVQDYEWRLYNPALAGGALLDIGVYVLYNSFRFLGADYTSLIAKASMASTGVDETVTMQLQYPDGFSNLYCSIKHRALSSAMVYGEDGYISIPLFWKTKEAMLYNKMDEVIDHFQDNRKCHGFQYEIEHFIDCVEKGLSESPVLTHALTGKVMTAMDEIRAAIGLRYPFE